ncbi:MAG TPA: hypothetical protein DHD79_10575 [Firmicutes bacterium]|jgi:putative sporulation protein YtxC|nr:hypothetical protein [Bacillota bacterium]HAW71538.1 hypothetical protein [Bacillota bacterium]HAZ21382.1 hypothetical protein [Bacillota bacterium]HBE05489.1 hypothetical protein [Bacillota bacterium]HBG45047.1 hypothetical protein [Bacillota bacterium]
MEVFSFATTGALTQLSDEVNSHLNRIRNIAVSLERQTADPFSVLFCALETVNAPENTENEKISAIAKYQLAQAIAETIMVEGEEWYLKKYLSAHYKEIDPVNRYTIQSDAIPIAYHRLDNFDFDARLYWRAVITDEVDQFLTGNSHLNLRGFLLFRLKPFCRALEEAARRAANKFLVEKEYLEFVKLLQYFVEMQESREEVVHVLLSQKGPFTIFNASLFPIDRRYMGGRAEELVAEDEYGDLLISVLITISPTKIVLHNNNDAEAVQTIRNVFEDRIELCTGCELCCDDE